MVNIYERHDACSLPSLPDRKMSRTALQLLRSFLQPLFFALFLSRGLNVCVSVRAHSEGHCASLHRC